MSEELKKGIPKGIMTGYTEFSKEEKEKYDSDLEKILKEKGILKNGETIKDKKHPS